MITSAPTNHADRPLLVTRNAVNVLRGRHGRLGDAVLAPQAAYAETGALSELLRLDYLLGDPALTLR